MKNVLKKILLVSSLVGVASANAAGPDFTSLTAGVDFATVIAAIFAVGLLVIGLDMAILGFHKIRAMAKGGK